MQTLIPAALFLALALVSLTLPLHAAPRDAQWKEVEQAVQKGLPKTAIENLEPIIQGALKDKAWGEVTKAIGRKLVLEGNIQGNKPEEKIARLEAEIAKAPKEIAPLLHTLQAHWYWQYFQANRWRFLQRTATAQAPGKDFTTWDLPRLFHEIDLHFQKALASASTLQKIPIASFDDLLLKGNLPDTYRPTLYDFLAHEALEFYKSGEQAGAKPEEAYELSADGPIFEPATKFLEWHRTFAFKDFPDSSIPKALDLYGQLMRFHERDGDPTAFVDLDLARLVYGYNVAVGDSKDTRYAAALKTFVDRWADHEVSALALHHWANRLDSQQTRAQARELALRGYNAHPNSPGGLLCYNLVQQIEAKSLQLATEDVWNEPWPKITVNYRNLTNLHLRLIAADWDRLMRGEDKRPAQLDPTQVAALGQKPAVKHWAEPLPPTTDYLERRVELPIPPGLAPGYYLLLGGSHPEFGGDEPIFYDYVWVSDLALVSRPRAGKLEGFVLDARTGEPIAGAEVEAWARKDDGNFEKRATVTTDPEGLFLFSGNLSGNRSHLLRARKGERQVASRNEVHRHDRGPQRPFEQTLFFTDRTLYRPGQIIQYKGLCLKADQARNEYQPLAGRDVTVVFRDVNRREIARQKHRANDYGSFAGSFNAPRQGITGRMSLSVEGTPSGATAVQVEEYKRPKFRVDLEAPKTAPRLNGQVSLQGRALAYTGAAIDGAPVKYRVVRTVQYPIWWGWFRWRPAPENSQEIAHGTTHTGADGNFTIEFTAQPDRSVPEADEPMFHYRVYADVTDLAGETRSADRLVQVGYTALQASLSAEDWLTVGQPVVLRISTTTLDGEPQIAEGKLKIHRLQQPAQVLRPKLADVAGFGEFYLPVAPSLEPDGKPDAGDPNSWRLGEVVAEFGFSTGTNGLSTNQIQLPAGPYRAVLETQDRFGKKVTALQPLRVLDPTATKFGIRIPQLLAAPSWSLEPGDELQALWGTGYDEGRAFIEIEHRNQMLLRFWTRPGQTQQEIRHRVTESQRGGFTLHVTQVRENRAYLQSRAITVPWSNKDLALRWEHFTSKLEPGQKETWTAVIEPRKTGADQVAAQAAAELVAALYDASLDQFALHRWQQRFSIFYHDHTTAQPQFANATAWFQHVFGHWPVDSRPVDIRYRQFPPYLTTVWRGNELMMRRYGLSRGAQVQTLEMADSTPAMAMTIAPAPVAAEAAALPMDADAGVIAGRALVPAKGGAGVAPEPQGEAAPRPDLSQVTARQNLNETAFFFPQLTSDSNGVVRLTFTMPEALTEWRFLGFAHDRQLRSGYLEAKTVTAKDLMVQPNPPRFLREGDLVEFTVKVSNQSDRPQSGKVGLTFTETLSGQSVDTALGNRNPERDFEIPAKESRAFSWRIEVPDRMGFLNYKAVASTGKISDGEEGCLPVLSRRIFVTESLPLPIRGPATKKFEFTKLLRSGRSDTLQHQAVTVQMVSNPAWYAVMALPYLMEFPHECSEQTFNRFYANALARFIANSDPKIRRVFDQWKNTPALDSPLEKNQDLKSVLIEETPWLRQAQNESQARQNVGILFDDNRLSYETDATLRKLTQMQLGDGLWPWFPGGRGNEYITLYIVTGFGRLRHLGADIQVNAALRALQRLDAWMDERYQDIQRLPHKEAYVPSATDALYLYGRSFFLKDRPVDKARQPAIDFFLAQARKHWLQTGNRQTQGHLAIALKRWGGTDNLAVARDILHSLKERSVTDEELGRFWRDTELSWWWYRAPIETQALMIEAFDEVIGDTAAVEECKVWLLKQKQTQDWKTTKATADAVYSLLLRGRDALASTNLVQLEIGGIDITPTQSRRGLPLPGGEGRGQGKRAAGVEAGTGYYEKRFAPSEIKPKLGEITVRKVDQGVAWGSVHWQYLEDMTQVTPYEGTPLKLKKALFVKKTTAKGPVLEAVNGPLAVGDELVVRIELRVDRDMEYVHLKDQRGSGTEPVNVLSRYKYQDGLAYYESTRDTASHFFIDYLPKGVYVFEYSSRVQLRGEYQTGMASIQCMYAPEFNSHSESLRLTVR